MEKVSNLWRVLHLINIINCEPGLTVSELAERCEVSTRTVYRYLNLLKMAGLPIYTDKGYRFLQEMHLPPVNFTLPEAISLCLASSSLIKQKGTPFSLAAKQAFEKIAAQLPSQLKNLTATTPKYLSFGESPKVNYAKKSDIFKKLEVARVQKQTCLINHHSFARGETLSRLVNPLGLIYRQGFWYLIAFCHKCHEVRLFRIDRIKSVQLLKEKFKPPVNFSVDEYMKDAWQIMRGKPYKIKIKVKGQAVKLITETKWHQSQQLELHKDNSVTVSFYIGSFKEIIPWILTFGRQAKVISPPQLKKALLNLIKEVQSVYTEKT